MRPVGARPPGDVPVRGRRRLKRSKDIWLEGVIKTWRALPASERAREWAEYLEARGMPIPITACCATCRFWASDDGDVGDCCWLPPVVDGDGVSVFPNTDRTTWCGSWECSAVTDRQGAGVHE